MTDSTPTPTDRIMDAEDKLTEAALEETRLYLGELIAKNLPARTVVDSDFTFLNERLAAHYDIPGVEGIAALGQWIDHQQQVEQTEQRQADRIGQPLFTWGERSPPLHQRSKGATRHRLLRHVRTG